MEVYAGFLEHTDHHVGRLVDSLKDLEILDDTLIFYIVGDNGASAEGTPNGCFNELVTLNGAFGVETTEFMVSKIAEFGTPTAYNHYAVGWAHAMDTPYQWTKQIASHWGGTRNGMVVHWPNGIKATGEVRNQFHHVIDVAPTILEAAGLPAPTFVNGIQQAPIEGVSMAYSFDDGKADDRHTTQYFEMFVNRGIYHEGWTAVTRHSIPWAATKVPALDDDVWELYGPDDWTQVTEHRDPAAREARAAPTPVPDRGDEVQRPAARRSAVRAIQFGSGRPPATDPWQHAGAVRWDGQAVRELGHRHQEQVPRHHGRGRRPRRRRPRARSSRRAARSAGGCLYMHEGRPAYCYNLFGIQRFKVYGDEVVPSGEHQLRVEFAYDGGGVGKGGSASLFVDGSKVGEGRVDATVPMAFSADETTDVGTDSATPVTDDLVEGKTTFNGRVRWVQIDLDEDAKDADHLISPDERYRLAMARQ